jgi:hypothetical protein
MKVKVKNRRFPRRSEWKENRGSLGECKVVVLGKIRVRNRGSTQYKRVEVKKRVYGEGNKNKKYFRW